MEIKQKGKKFVADMKIPILLAVFLSSTMAYGQSITKNPCEDNDFSSCILNGKPGFCEDDICHLAFKPTSQPFLIRIRYPQNNKYAQKASMNASEMYLRGNGLGLNWKKGKMMTKSTEKDTWKLQLQFTIPGYELPSGQKPPARFEYRVYLNDSRDMLGPNFVVNLPLSTNVKNSTKTPEIWEFPWFFNKEGRIIRQSVYSPQFGGNRRVYYMLPPSFYENTYKRYETLIVNDGFRLIMDMIFPQLTILMVERALIKEILVVGISNDNERLTRFRLFAVSNGSETHCLNGDDDPEYCNGCLKCNSSTCSYEMIVKDYRRCYKWVKIQKPKGQIYLDFIQDTVIPKVRSNYRALSGAKNLGILGHSLGGLMACHAIWTRPQTFGSAVCMASSFWWPFPENGTFPDDAGFEFTTKTLMKHRGVRPRQKIYIDVGGEEGETMINPARDASRILASTPYFEMNKNLWFYIWEGHYHTFITAMQRMWVPLIALYGTEGSPDGETARNVGP